jgi:hypothetical protein
MIALHNPRSTMSFDLQNQNSFGELDYHNKPETWQAPWGVYPMWDCGGFSPGTAGRLWAANIGIG